MQSGGYLVISHITADEVEPAKAKAAQEVYADASAPAVPRTLAEVESFFMDVAAWRAEPRPGRALMLYGGVARKASPEPIPRR
jgi:hypothetical protein